MASTVPALIAVVRGHLNEATARFWTDASLAGLMNLGAKDLFRAINDNFQHYFLTIDTENVTHPSGASELDGMPDDVGIIRGIEPLDLTARPGLNYEKRDYNHVDFQRARAQGSQDPSSALTVYYCVTEAGAPVAAPVVQVAPVLSATIALRVSYVPALPTLVVALDDDDDTAATQVDYNPIPGESDNALVAWTTAYAMAAQSEDQAPNAGWLSIFESDKTKILTSLTPRATEDDDVAEAFFEDLWQ